MAAPVYVTFRHMSPRAALEEHAREQAARLERFYGRIVDCRVLLEPNDAGVLRVVVELTVPGERLIAAREAAPEGAAAAAADPPAPPDARWLHAVHEAFDGAARILQGYAGRRRSRSRRRERPLDAAERADA